MPEMTDAYEWHGRTMVGSDGEKIGTISKIYEDARDRQARMGDGLQRPVWHQVELRAAGGRLAPGEDVRATATKDQVKDAPGVENDRELSESEERRLFEHYGVPYTTEGSTTAQGQPDGGEDVQADRSGSVGHDTSGPTTDDAMTRSEEELRVGTRQREAGRARLRKHVSPKWLPRRFRSSARKSGSSVSRSPTATVTKRWTGRKSPKRSTRSSCTRRSRSWRSGLSPRSAFVSTPTPITEDREISEEVRKEQIETDGPEIQSQDRPTR